MSNWEKEVKKLLSEQYGGKTYLKDMFGNSIEKHVEEDAKKWLSLLAKQKTQLLKEVRGKVFDGELMELLKNPIQYAVKSELEKKLKELEENLSNE